MFDVKLVDINGNGIVVEFDSRLETLAEVELLVKDTINTHLHITTTRLEYVDELVYSVWVCGREIGVVVIKDVNAPSQAKR